MSYNPCNDYIDGLNESSTCLPVPAMTIEADSRRQIRHISVRSFENPAKSVGFLECVLINPDCSVYNILLSILYLMRAQEVCLSVRSWSGHF